MGIATVGIAIAWRLFGADIAGLHIPSRPERVRELTAKAPFLYRASLNKWWLDDLNHLLFMVVGGRIAAARWWFDREVVDGVVEARGASAVDAGRGLGETQTGRGQNDEPGMASA